MHHRGLTVRPFAHRASDAALADLRARLRATRWPAPTQGGDPFGFAPAELRRICAYWADGFDWRAAEARIFSFPHFMAEIGPHRLHFLHLRGSNPAALPLVLSHGWPGSFLEFFDLLPLLADRDLVIPSLPGFGFSHPLQPGCNLFVIADLVAQLMPALGYTRYGVQGGDFGASVSTILGLKHADCVAGVHLNYIPGSYRPDLSSGPPLDPVEDAFLAESAHWADLHGAYAHVQRREPLTLAYGLNDSPAGLAAWILQRFLDWGDCRGSLEPCFPLDTLLANLTLYWLTGSIASACRLYRETAAAPVAFGPGERVRVPTAVARFPREAPFPPRPWVERGYHLVRWTEMPAGGHFAALEQPARLAADIRAFFDGVD